ncbi:MAG: cyclopropane-fatty-acyl-phospholipid synthase family protein [Bacteroidota bacterium]
MQTEPTPTYDDNIHTSLVILQEVFNNYHPRNFAIRFWDGTTWDPEYRQQALFALILQHPGSLRRMFLHINEVTLGEAYVYNDFDIEGDIEAALTMADYLLGMQLSLAKKIHLGRLLYKLPAEGKPRIGRQAAALRGSLHSRERDRQAVTYHYNVSNDFFALWLDKRMVYSCAYFISPEEDLDIAQERKLDYICRKMRLHRGERLLDIGCGWGGLIIHAAKKYGVEALGITLSEPQARLANELIRREGLAHRCRVEVRDYRDIGEPDTYDKIVSVGMFEHVGESMLPEYFDRARRLLRQGGVFLNHGIAYGPNQPAKKAASFSDRYIFPDGELLPINTTLCIAEKCGFEVRDVESMREHYMHTLRHWRRRLEAHHEEAVKLTDEPTYRIWRLNHAGSAHGFKTGQLSIYQSLLVKSGRDESNLPLTRADWYS